MADNVREITRATGLGVANACTIMQMSSSALAHAGGWLTNGPDFLICSFTGDNWHFVYTRRAKVNGGRWGAVTHERPSGCEFDVIVSKADCVMQKCPQLTATASLIDIFTRSI